MDKANIRLSWDHEGVDPSDLRRLCGVAGIAMPEPFARDDAAKLFGPGSFGMFAFSGDALVGLARAFNDTLATTWLADLAVDPGWRDQGVDRLLLEHINDRFRRTALYCASPVEMVDFFRDAGIRPKAKLVACRRPPGPAAKEPGELPGVVTGDAPARYKAADFDAVFESVGFGMADGETARDPMYRQFFGAGTSSFFAETTEGRLVGLVRVFSDDLTKCYVAEICVHPEWQRRGIARALVDRVVARFSHTAIWTEAFPDAVRLLASCGIVPDADFVGCSRAPLE